MRSRDRQRSVVTMAAACAGLVVLTACSPGGVSARPASRQLPARANAALGTGTLYLLLGDVAISANLWRIDLDTGRVRQLTFNRPQYGVSNFSASPAGLVLGDARSGVDSTEIMVRGGPQLLSGGVGDSPKISEAGQIVDVASAEQGVRHGPWSHDRLLYWASPSSAYRTMYQVPPENLISIAWNPAGTRLLVTSRDRRRIGICDLASPRQVRDLGRLPGGALAECSWTARPARGT